MFSKEALIVSPNITGSRKGTFFLPTFFSFIVSKRRYGNLGSGVIETVTKSFLI